MKIFIFAAIVCGFCACSPITTAIQSVGTVTAFTNNGDTLRQWKNIVISSEVAGVATTSSVKQFGFNFFDSKTGKYVIISNSVPVIIEYGVNDASSTDDVSSLTSFDYSKYDAEVKRAFQQILRTKYYELKDERNKCTQESEEYKSLTKAMKILVELSRKVDSELGLSPH